MPPGTEEPPFSVSAWYQSMDFALRIQVEVQCVNHGDGPQMFQGIIEGFSLCPFWKQITGYYRSLPGGRASSCMCALNSASSLAQWPMCFGNERKVMSPVSTFDSGVDFIASSRRLNCLRRFLLDSWMPG